MAKVIRNTGYKLPSIYHDDILEWIPEGLRMLGVTNAYVTKSTGNCNDPDALQVKNHCVRLPRGFQTILAVEDENGRIVSEGGDVTDLTNPSTRAHRGAVTEDIRPSVFNTNPNYHQTSDGTPTTKPGTSIPLYGEDIQPTSNSTITNHYYKIQGNYLQISFEEGFVKIHYLAIDTCKDGYPLVPDNENFTQALYWYVLMMLIGAGYEHKVFSYEKAESEFDKYAAKAIAEVSYPSLDTAARINRSTIRLIPPYNFYEDFFIGSEKPERLNK